MDEKQVYEQNHLFEAAEFGDLPLALSLIAQGADVRAVDKEGNTVLHHAARSGDGECLAGLLQCGVDLAAQNHAGETPLHLALAGGSSSFTSRPLLDAGAPLNVQDDLGNTPLHYLLQCAETGSVFRSWAPGHAASLVARGADLFIANHDGLTPMQMIRDFAHATNDLEEWGELLERGRAHDQALLLDAAISPPSAKAGPRL